MKKLLSLALALAMCASLAACGGSDDGGVSSAGSDVSTSAGGPTDAQLKALTEAYQQVSEVYNEAATKANENGWAADEQTLSDLNTIAECLEPIGLALNGDMASLEGSDFDGLPGAILEFLPEAQALLEKVSEPYEGAVTDPALVPLANTYNDLANLYNEVYPVAEANGWLDDEQTATELQAMAGTISFVGSGLTDDPSKLENVEDMDGLVAQLQELLPELQAIGERVSVPFEG